MTYKVNNCSQEVSIRNGHKNNMYINNIYEILKIKILTHNIQLL